MLTSASICGVFKLAVGVSRKILLSHDSHQTPGRFTDSNHRRQVDMSKSRREFLRHFQSFLK